MENIREIPVIFMFAAIADLMERQPLVFIRSAEIHETRYRRVAGHQRSERRMAKFSDDPVCRRVELYRGGGHGRPVVMNWTEQAGVRLIAAPDIFDVAA